ncbi:MAG: hypothetical protein WAZ18_02230 [Alphaproteobacteria bacterium]
MKVPRTLRAAAAATWLAGAGGMAKAAQSTTVLNPYDYFTCHATSGELLARWAGDATLMIEIPSYKIVWSCGTATHSADDVQQVAVGWVDDRNVYWCISAGPDFKPKLFVSPRNPHAREQADDILWDNEPVVFSVPDNENICTPIG